MRQRIAGSLLIWPWLPPRQRRTPGAAAGPARRIRKPVTEAATRDTLLDLMRQLEELQTGGAPVAQHCRSAGHELEQIKAGSARCMTTSTSACVMPSAVAVHGPVIPAPLAAATLRPLRPLRVSPRRHSSRNTMRRSIS